MPQTTIRGRFFHKAAVVVAAVSLATLFTFPLAPRMFHSRDLLFVAAVILVTRYEGGIAGICTAVLAVLVFDWFFDQTPGVLDLTIGNGIRISVFISLSAMVALLDRQRRRAMDSLVTTNQKLQTALDEIKTLRGTLLICSYCSTKIAQPRNPTGRARNGLQRKKMANAPLFLETGMGEGRGLCGRCQHVSDPIF